MWRGRSDEAILDIYASGTTWPALDYSSGTAQFAPPDGGEVDYVFAAGTFEAYTQVLARVARERVPFRVSTRTNPSRLVVDVRGQD